MRFNFQPLNQNLSTIDVDPALRDVLQQLLNATLSLQQAVAQLAEQMNSGEDPQSVKLIGESFGS